MQHLVLNEYYCFFTDISNIISNKFRCELNSYSCQPLLLLLLVPLLLLCSRPRSYGDSFISLLFYLWQLYCQLYISSLTHHCHILCQTVSSQYSIILLGDYKTKWCIYKGDSHLTTPSDIWPSQWKVWGTSASEPSCHSWCHSTVHSGSECPSHPLLLHCQESRWPRWKTFVRFYDLPYHTFFTSIHIK